jgi:hypothetical protein
VKVYEDIPLEALAALADETKRQGLHFAGHVSEETLRVIDAVRYGQRSVEHVRSNLIVCFADSNTQLEQLFEYDKWDVNDRAWSTPHKRRVAYAHACRAGNHGYCCNRRL